MRGASQYTEKEKERENAAPAPLNPQDSPPPTSRHLKESGAELSRLVCELASFHPDVRLTAVRAEEMFDGLESKFEIQHRVSQHKHSSQPPRA